MQHRGQLLFRAAEKAHEAILGHGQVAQNPIEMGAAIARLEAGIGFAEISREGLIEPHAGRELVEDHVRGEAAVGLDAGLAHLESLLRLGAYAHDAHVSIADVWLTPVRFSLDGLIDFAKRPALLERHPAIAGYTAVIQRDPALSRVWQEMTDGLKAFYAARATART